MTAITLTASDGHDLGGYLALPQGTPRGGIVVIQEIFGVNVHIRDMCDRFAAAGYAALAPAIFDRIERDFECGYEPDDIAMARAFIPRLDWNGVMLDTEAARAELAQYGKVGIVGYCLGGSVAFLAAAEMDGIAAASCYYGGKIKDFADKKPRCPVQLHYGALDKGIPPENYEAVHAARPDCEFYLYEEADHGFNCDRRASFHPEAAAMAQKRTEKLFAEYVG
ncbi:dienelactone hydrolase family protein [Pararhodobacter marinus]|uniref:dienelactone hydrolase family protein n=1 Tax=Pararhodobacter marinus TaxID=2184063 RepID=UPI00351531CE